MLCFLNNLMKIILESLYSEPISMRTEEHREGSVLAVQFHGQSIQTLSSTTVHDE